MIQDFERELELLELNIDLAIESPGPERTAFARLGINVEDLEAIRRLNG